jgi:putrescine importer
MSEHNPTLVRTLGLRSVVLFGLAYMTPLIVLGIFGIIAEVTAGATPSAYLVALMAMIFTAWSYGRMSAAYPVAGSAYTYVRKTIDSRIGFLVGWAVLLDYVFLPFVIWLFGAVYLQAQFPDVPFWMWIVLFIVLTTILNILGIQVAAKANFLLMAFQILVIVIFVLLSLAHVFASDGATGWFSTNPFSGVDSNFSMISAGAAIAAYSFLGFDAVTTLTEETIDARRTIPKAIMLTAIIGGAIFIIVAYTTQLVHPGGTFDDSASAAFDIAKEIGGSFFSSLFLAGVVLAQFSSGISAQASASRLMYAMGRDHVLPHRFFGFVHEKYRTPALNIALIAVIGLLALKFDPATSTSFINFGAFVAFTFVNISVIAYFLKHRGSGEALNPFGYIVVPAIGAAIDVYLLTQLDSNAIRLGLVWLALGIVYLAFLTKGFRKAPPEMEFSEEVEVGEPVHGG